MASVIQGHQSRGLNGRPSKIPVRKLKKPKIVFSSGESCDEDQVIRAAFSRYDQLSTYDCLSDSDDFSTRQANNRLGNTHELLMKKTKTDEAGMSTSFNQARCDVSVRRKTRSLPRLSIQEPSLDSSLREPLMVSNRE